MDDLEIDRALQAALSVEPSPEFVARVRMTIAEAPRPSILAGCWKPVAAIGCAAVLAIAMGLPRGESAPSTAGLKPSTTYVPSAPPVVVPTFRSAAPAIVAPTFSSAKAPIPAASIEPPMPEVLIAQKDIEALREFVASANEVRFTASFDETPAPTPWLVTELPTTQTHNN